MFDRMRLRLIPDVFSSAEKSFLPSNHRYRALSFFQVSLLRSIFIDSTTEQAASKKHKAVDTEFLCPLHLLDMLLDPRPVDQEKSKRGLFYLPSLRSPWYCLARCPFGDVCMSPIQIEIVDCVPEEKVYTQIYRFVALFGDQIQL